MRLHSLLIIPAVVFLLTSCAAPVVTPTPTAPIAPTPTSSVDPCLTAAKTYRPGSLPLGRIAFECYSDPNKIINIYVFDTTTGNIVNLTDDASRNHGVQWSPNGQQFAFHSNRGSRSGIYLMNADGAQLKWLADGKSAYWSPDGSKIAIVRNDGVYVANKNSDDMVRVADNRSVFGWASWSPDGSQIALDLVQEDRRPSVYVASADGSQQAKLANFPDNSFNPTWSPTDRTIAALRVHERDLDLYKMDLDGGGPIQLTHDLPLVEWFSWSPNGQQIAFIASIGPKNQLYVVNADGGEPRPISNMAGNTPSWSPDSRYLVFPYDQIYVARVADGQLIQLTDSSLYKSYPAWSPK